MPGNQRPVTFPAQAPSAGGGGGGGGGAVATMVAPFTANDVTLPASPAGITSRNGHPLVAFDDSSDENGDFHGVMDPAYTGQVITVDVHWVAASAVAGNVKWDGAFEALTGQDIDINGFAAIQTATGVANGTNGVETVTSITFTQAQADTIAASGAFRFRLTRDTAVGGNMVGDAQVLRVAIRRAAA